MIRFNLLKNYGVNCFKNGKFFLILYFVISSITAFIFFYKIVSSYSDLGIDFSLADFVLILANPFLFYINSILFPSMVVFIKIKNDFQVNNLIRYGNCVQLYVNHYFMMFVVQFIVTLLQFIVSLSIGSFGSKCLINFGIRGSYFKFINQGHGTDISFTSICLITLFFCFCAALGINTFFLIVFWLKNNIGLTYFFIMFISIVDIITGLGICGGLGVSHNQLLAHNPFKAIIILVLPFSNFFIGAFISSKKDFLNEK